MHSPSQFAKDVKDCNKANKPYAHDHHNPLQHSIIIKFALEQSKI